MDPAAIDDPVATPITPSRPRIGVVAINAGNANLGDEAVLTGALLAIRTRMGDPDITVFSVNPAATAEHHRVRAASLPIGSVGGAGTGPVRRAAHRMWDPLRGMRILAPAGRWSVRLGRAAAGLVALPVAITRLALQLRGTDVMILAGSNQLEDAPGGAWGYPFMVLLCTVLARLSGARVAFMSVGAGPLGSRLSQRLCVAALRLTTYASFRDRGSLELMQGLGYRGAGKVVPDLAYALELPAQDTRRHVAPKRVAVNVFPFHDPQYDQRVTDGGASFAEYVEAIADFVIGVNARGMQLVLFGTQHGDRHAIDLIQERVHARAPELGVIEQLMPTSYEELGDIIERSDVVVATRYHGILVGTLHGRPTIGVCYEAKSKRLLELAGIEQFAVEADMLQADALLDRLTDALRPGGLSEQIRARAEDMHHECLNGVSEALERCIPQLAVESRA